jgi:very-short-patch-repair endonuclease/predicted transcriptional regulator of viral defense system
MRSKLVEEPLDRLIGALAATQHGVVSLAQLIDLGLSRHQVQRRVQAGRLHRIHRGVYAVGHRMLSRQGRLMAAVLACGEGAALSHRPAAAHWNLLRWSGVPEVSVPSPGGRAKREGFTVHRAALAAEEVSILAEIPVTSVARTLVDCASVLTLERLELAIAEAEKQHLFDQSAVERVFELHPRLRGRAALNQLLAKWQDVTPELRTKLERGMYRICRLHGLPRPAANVQVEGYTADFYWEEAGLIVETDGWDTHGTRASFEDDRFRDARLTAAGFKVVRFTYWQVTREPGYVAGILRSLLPSSAAR